MLGAGNIHSSDHRRGFSDLVDLRITRSFTFQPAHRKRLSSRPLMVSEVEFFISPSHSGSPSPRPTISSCLRLPACLLPAPSSAEGLTLVILENRSNQKRGFPQAPASPVSTLQHICSVRCLPSLLPRLPVWTVPETKATPLCSLDPRPSGSLEPIVQRSSVLSSVANFCSLLDQHHQHTNMLLFLPS